MADGKVVYEVDVDDSKAESQIKEVNQKINKESKDTEAKQKRTFKEIFEDFKQKSIDIVKRNKKSGDNINEDNKDVSSNMKDMFMNVADELGISFAKLGKLASVAGLALLGKEAVSSVIDLDKAVNQLGASTGVTGDKLKDYEGVLKKVYANNYGEDFNDIANAMKEIRTQIGPVVDDWDPSALQEFTESAFALRDTFGYEINESVRAANMMMNQFGIDGVDAYNMIAQATQNGLDKNGDLLDSINEYSVHFNKLGFYAEDMFAVLEAGSKNGAFSIDKVGDAMKEFSIRAINGSETTKEGFKAIGLDADKMSKKFAKGGKDAKDAFMETVDALAAMKDPMKQNVAGVNLFGTMWEDLGPEVITSLSNINSEMYSTSDALYKIKEVKYDDLGSMFEGLTRQVELLILPLGEALIPILTSLIQVVLPILEALLPPIIDVLYAVIEPILGIINTLTPLIDLIMSVLTPTLEALSILFQAVFDAIGQTVQSKIGNVVGILSGLIDFILGVFTGDWSRAWNGIKNIFSNVLGFFGIDANATIKSLKKIFGGIVDFVTGIFTGDWKRAWNGVKSIFKGIIDGFANIFKTPINWIIDGINSFLGGLNKIKIPDWVPVVGGKGFNVPKIKRLKVGMDYVPNDLYPAYLDKGETVLTAPKAEKLRSWGGVEGVERMINGLINTSPSFDYERMAELMKLMQISVYLDKKMVGYGVTDSVDENMGMISSRKDRFGI